MKAIETFMQGKDVFRLDAANHLQAYEYDDLHGRKVISVSPLLEGSGKVCVVKAL